MAFPRVLLAAGVTEVAKCNLSSCFCFGRVHDFHVAAEHFKILCHISFTEIVKLSGLTTMYMISTPDPASKFFQVFSITLTSNVLVG